MTITTRLEVVNQMLTAVGEAPATTLVNPTGDTATADIVLTEITRRVHVERHWHYNTFPGERYVPNGDGEIVVGSDVVFIDTTDYKYADIEVVQHGDRLYDRKNRTYVFTKDYVEVTVSKLMDWDVIPEPLLQYIAARATRTFVQRRENVKAVQAMSDLKQDEARALADALRWDANSKDNSIFDSYSTYRVLNRYPSGYDDRIR